MEESRGLSQPLTARDDLPDFDLPWHPAEPIELHRGDLCPSCGEGSLDYDGLLNLSCAVCGFSLGGCFT